MYVYNFMTWIIVSNQLLLFICACAHAYQHHQQQYQQKDSMVNEFIFYGYETDYQKKKTNNAKKQCQQLNEETQTIAKKKAKRYKKRERGNMQALRPAK